MELREIVTAGPFAANHPDVIASLALGGTHRLSGREATRALSLRSGGRDVHREALLNFVRNLPERINAFVT